MSTELSEPSSMAFGSDLVGLVSFDRQQTLHLALYAAEAASKTGSVTDAVYQHPPAR